MYSALGRATLGLVDLFQCLCITAKSPDLQRRDRSVSTNIGLGLRYELILSSMYIKLSNKYLYRVYRMFILDNLVSI